MNTTIMAEIVKSDISETCYFCNKIVEIYHQVISSVSDVTMSLAKIYRLNQTAGLLSRYFLHNTIIMTSITIIL